MAQLACPCGCGHVLPNIEAQAHQDQLTFVVHWLTSCGLTVEDVHKEDRRPAMVQVRREIATYLRAHGWSLPAIGRWLKRDHTTVMHLLRS